MGSEALDETDPLLDADVALRLSQFELAEHLYTQALEGTTDRAHRARALGGLGEIDFHAGRLDDAVERLEEARALGDSRRAWTYYADALTEFGPAGFVLARLIRLRLRFAPRQPPRLPYPTRPNVGRALSVGKALLRECPRLVALVRILRILSRGTRGL